MKRNLPNQISRAFISRTTQYSSQWLKLLVLLCFLLPLSVFSQTIGLTSFTDIGPAGNKINSATPVNYTLDSWLFTASASSGNASINVVSSNAEGLSNDFAVDCVRSTTTGGAYLLYGSFKATTLTAFKLNNFKYRYSVATGGTSLATITITGYKNGSAVTGATVDYSGISPVNSNTAWNTADVSANSSFNNVDEIRVSGSGGDGTYTIAWFDAINISNAVTAGTVLSATTGAQTNVSCNGGSNGSATVDVTGGTAPYTYSWSPSGGTAATASGLSAGNYTVTVTDAASATTTLSFTITQPSALSKTSSQTNVSCNGGSNGSASVSVTGGTAPYTYSWSPSGGTATTATGLSAGTYTVSITDANGCTTAQNFILTQPSVISSSGSQTNIVCNGTSSGSAAVSVSGGTAPYSYSWQNNTAGTTLPQTTASVSSLSAGSYTVTITDANGCSATRTFTLTQSAPFNTTGSQTSVSTYGGSDGSATVSASGGTPGYTYSWSPSGGTAATASGLAAGNYTVTITDANGCTVSRNYTITQPAAVTAAPVILAPANGSLSNNRTPVYSGAAVAGGTVTLYVDGNSVGTTTASGGNFSLAQPTALSDGSHTVYATAQSSGQTVSANSNTNTFTIDATAPAAPVVVSPANGSIVSNNRPSVSGAAEASSSIKIFVDGTLQGTTTTSNSGNYAFQLTASLAEGSHTVRTTATDAAGNGSANSNTNTFTIDQTAPSVTISSTASGSTANSTIPVTVTFSEVVNGFTAGDVAVTGGTLSGFSGSGSNYSFTVTATAPGTITVGIATNSAQDAAGNGNTAAPPFSIIYAPVSSNANLSNLAISSGTLSPGFASGTNSYSASVSYATTSLTVTPTASDANATITVNGVAVSSGNTTGAIALAAGSNTITTVVTAQDGTTQKTYSLTVTRAALSSNANLSDLAINSGALTPTFALGTTSYSASVSNATTSITVTPTTSNANASVTVNGTAVGSGTASTAIPLVVGSNAVTITVTAQDGATTKNYTLNINRAQANQQITFNPIFDKTYGDPDFTLNATASSGLPVSYISSDAAIATVSGSKITIHKAGRVTLTASQAGDANYGPAFPVFTVLTISPKTLFAALVGPVSKVYDGNNSAALTSSNFTLTGKVGNDDVALSYPSTGIYYGSSVNARTVVYASGLSLSGDDKANYVLGSVDLYALIGTITPASVQVNLSGTVAKVYDGSTVATLTAANYQLSGVIGNDRVDFTKPVRGTYDNSNVGSNKAVLVSGIALSGSGAINYVLTGSNVSANIGQISPKTLTISADNQSRNFDSPNPALTITYSGFVNGETSANLTALPVATTSATVTSIAGTYPITVSNATSSNYDFSYVNGTLTIGKASTVITFAAIPAKTYGDADFVLSASASSGLPVTYASSDPAVAMVDASGKVHMLSAGVTTITANQQGNTNYDAATAVTQSLTVGKAALVITADAQTKTYGEANPVLTVSYSGFVNGEASSVLSAQPVVMTSVNTASAVGVYPITISGATAANYNISYAPAEFNVVKAALTVTAEDKTRIQGTANPALTVSYTGFVGGDTQSALSSQPAISTEATVASAAGAYPITARGAQAANYSITYVPGTLTVTSAAVNAMTFTPVTLHENQSAGTSAGTLSAASANSNAVFTYSFSGGSGAADNASFNLSGNKLLTMTSFDYETKSSYNVRIRATDQYGQSAEQTFTIRITDVNEAPVMARVLDEEVCLGRENHSITLSGISPGPETMQNVTLDVQSNNPGLFNNLSVSSVSGGKAILSYSLATTGTAVVTVTVRDNGGRANGGVDSFSQTFTITSNALPSAVISSDKGIQISKGDIVTLTATGGDSYSWDATPNAGGTSSSAAIKVRPEKTATYQVRVSNASGCTSMANITIEVADDYALIQPANILTPNGDGKNDTWVVKNIDLYPNHTILIYDRGGRKLIEVKHYNNSWDGSVNGLPLTEGTYYYVIDFGEGKAVKKGFITILRNR